MTLTTFDEAIMDWYSGKPHGPNAWKADLPKGFDWQRGTPPAYEPLTICLNGGKVVEGYCAVHREMRYGGGGQGAQDSGIAEHTELHWSVDNKPLGRKGPQVVAWSEKE